MVYHSLWKQWPGCHHNTLVHCGPESHQVDYDGCQHWQAVALQRGTPSLEDLPLFWKVEEVKPTLWGGGYYYLIIMVTCYKHSLGKWPNRAFQSWQT